MASHGLKCSKCSDCGSSSDDGVWQEDVAEDLNTFVRLSKAGHFTRAEEFFHEFLESHAGDFAVAAQYAESLIEQGSFGPAEEFLTAWLSKDVNADDEEMTVVRLLLATSRLYTRFDVREVGITALSSLERVGKVLIAENKSLLKLQIVTISLRLVDLVSRAPSPMSRLCDYILLRPPFKLSHEPDQDPTWEEVIVALLKHGHIWEANTLLTIHLRCEKPMESNLLRILDAVPEEDDTMYTLVRLTMLVSCSRSLLRQSWEVLMMSGVSRRCEDCAHDAFSSAMDGITDPIALSRAHQDYRLLSLEVDNKGLQSTGQLNPSSLDERSDVLEEMQDRRDIRKRAIDNSDYMLLLASYEQHNHPLPDRWLHDTGASKEAVKCLHPDAVSSQGSQDVVSPANDDILHAGGRRHRSDLMSIRESSSRQPNAPKPAKGPVDRPRWLREPRTQRVNPEQTL